MGASTLHNARLQFFENQMKLYATITSDRASKGQGGNKELVINITVGNISRREIANIVLRTNGGSLGYDEKNMYALEYYPVNRNKGGRIVLDKGDIEESGLKKCNNHVGWCAEHQTRHDTKGKRQKGECAICKQPTDGISCCIPL